MRSVLRETQRGTRTHSRHNSGAPLSVEHKFPSAAAERQRGLAEGEARIRELCEKARACLEVGKERRDGNYAFVCEKCASVFGYYGFEDYALELNERSGRIYEGT